MSSHGDFFKYLHCRLKVLRACNGTLSLQTTKPLHALAITLGPNLHQLVFLYNNVLSLYASAGQVSLARKVFDKMSERNVVSYNTMISAYSKFGDVEEAWKVFSRMGDCGFSPTQFTLGGLLSCDSLGIFRGFQLQALSVKNGLFYADAFVGTALLGFYGRSGCLDSAARAFGDIPRKSLVTWNLMISLFGQQGFVEECLFTFRELARTHNSLSECSFLGVLSGLSSEQDLEKGEQIHALVVKNGFGCEISVVNSLMNMYVKCVSIVAAEIMFEQVTVRDIVSWNTILGGLARSENPVKALEHFIRMSIHGTLPNQTTFVNVMTCCTRLLIQKYGQFFHAKIIKNAFESDVFVGSALVDFYSKCDRMEDAHSCFHDIQEKNVISWNSLILGYANKLCSTSISLLLQMLQLGFRPNEHTFSAVLKSSSTLELHQLHCLIIRTGYQNNDYVFSSLMASYAKHGLINDALVFVNDSDELSVVQSNIVAGMYNRSGQYHETVKLLSLLEEPDIVSWNIVIAACARSGYYREGFELFKHMHRAQIYTDNHTFVSLLSMCSKLCNLALGSSIHGLIIKSDFSLSDTFVCNVLIDMYGKCGSIGSSVKIFDEMTERNLITWTALISALGVHGYIHEAFDRFREMESLGFKPDKVTFIAMLTVCRHGGLVREGVELFREMCKSYQVEPEMDHYLCMVDLLARYGHLKEAEHLIATMPIPPNALIWRSFLEGCKRYKTAQDQEVEHVKLISV